MSSAKIVDNINLSPREIELLLNELDRAATTGETSADRKRKRWSLNSTKAILTVPEFDGRPKNMIALPRNLSVGGTGLIIGSFIHPGTTCTVAFKRIHGGGRSIKGKIVRCSLIRGHLHELGVIFEQAINPEEFIDFDDQHVFNCENINLKDLTGTILIVDDSIPQQKLLAHHFRESSLETIFAKDGETGLSMLSEQPNLIFVDDHMPDMDGYTFVERARAAQYANPILMLSGEYSQSIRRKAQEAGATDALGKPVAQDVLHKCVAEFLLLKTKGTPTGNAPIVASAAEVGMPFDLMKEYAKQLQQQSGELDQAIAAGDFDRIRLLAADIRGTSPGYGFEPIASLADRLMRSLSVTSDPSSCRDMAGKLAQACKRARAAA